VTGPRALELPDHREQSPAVADRFRRLRDRPVVLEASGLGLRYGEGTAAYTALHDVSFCVHRREFLAVIGPSGCGKSTLARLIAGLETPTAGEIRLDGRPVRGPGPDRGMVFQGYTLFPWLTVTGNVMFGPRLSGIGRSLAEVEARQWVDLVGLRDFADAWPNQLSGGMKQRVAIARALANRPRVLLMDEPFGALDAQTRARMQRHLLAIWAAVDVTIVFITHDLDEAILLADRILVLKAGPGEVLDLVEVPVPHPRSPAQALSPEFLATRRHLDQLIHPPGSAEATDPPVLRLTPVGDDVY
jgi:NitT/TauT family transport system ATP-binding protein